MEHLGVGQPGLRLPVPVVGPAGEIAGGLGEPHGLDLPVPAPHREQFGVHPAPARLGGHLVAGGGVAGARHVGGCLVQTPELDQDVGEGRGTGGQVRALAHPGQPAAAAPQLVLGGVEVVGEQGDPGDDETPVQRVPAGAAHVPVDRLGPGQVVHAGVELPGHRVQQRQLGEQGPAQAAVVADTGQRPLRALDRLADRPGGQAEQVDEVAPGRLDVAQHPGLLGVPDGGLHRPFRQGVAAGRHVGGGLAAAGERGADLVPALHEDR